MIENHEAIAGQLDRAIELLRQTTERLKQTRNWVSPPSSCTEQWTDLVGCYPPGPPHHCAVTIPHTAFHRCSCDAWIQSAIDPATADRILGRLPELSEVTLASLHDVARAVLQPDDERLPA